MSGTGDIVLDTYPLCTMVLRYLQVVFPTFFKSLIKRRL